MTIRELETELDIWPGSLLRHIKDVSWELKRAIREPNYDTELTSDIADITVFMVLRYWAKSNPRRVKIDLLPSIF